MVMHVLFNRSCIRGNINCEISSSRREEQVENKKKACLKHCDDLPLNAGSPTSTSQSSLTAWEMRVKEDEKMGRNFVSGVFRCIALVGRPHMHLRGMAGTVQRLDICIYPLQFS